MSLVGGSLYPKIDQRAFPFENNLAVPITVKKQRYENITPSSTGSSTTGVYGTAGGAAKSGLSQTLIFNIPAASDGTMLDLHNSYFQALLTVPNVPPLAVGGPINYGIAQFAANNLITDCKVTFGTEIVSENHTGNLYPWQAFGKDVLTMERPCVLSNPAAGNGARESGSAVELTENAIEEGNYLSYPLTIQAPGAGAGANSAALQFTLNYVDGQARYIRFKLKEGIFLTQKYFPSSMNITIQLTIKLANYFQELPNNLLEAVGNQITLTDINFLLNRVVLSEEASQAMNSALISHPYKYVLPYTSCTIRPLAAGQSTYNLQSIFQGETKPDLLLIAFQDTTVINQSYPYVACGNFSAAALSPIVTSLYAKQNGKQYPEADCEFTYRRDIRTYQSYVEQCLPDSDKVYLDYLHWLHHYTVYAISLRDDKDKIYGLAPSQEPANLSLNITFAAALANLTNVIILGMRHVGLEISGTGLINKIGWPN